VEYKALTQFSIKQEPALDEAWVQQRLVDDTSLLGLGDSLDVIDRERKQLLGGRLDLLLEDGNKDRRYCVELQLGKSDPSHIIRSIEYWDREQRKNPNTEHVAVLVAEDFPSRFMNVMHIICRSVPFIAIKLNALKVDTAVSLVFTRVFDESIQFFNVDEEDGPAEAVDREYWIQRSSPDLIQLLERMIGLAQQRLPNLSAKYNKSYVGVVLGSRSDLFVRFQPRRNWLSIQFRESIPGIEEKIDELDFSSTRKRSRIYFSVKSTLEEQRMKAIAELIAFAGGASIEEAEEDSLIEE